MKFIQSNIILYIFLLGLGLSGFLFSLFLPGSQGFYAFIILSAIGGLGVALYIYNSKKNQRHLVCPVGSDCNVVINSKYSKFLGISLEYLGMFYYSILILSYATLIFIPSLASGFFTQGLIFLTVCAFLFSLYLLFVQAFLLRQWCIWCLLSAFLSILIFIISLASFDFIISFLNESKGVINLIHTIGFIFGVGGSTVALFLFSRFLKDFDIDQKELETQKAIAEIVLMGLVLVFATQISFYVVDPIVISSSIPFLLKTIILFFIAMGHAVLMIIFAPFLASIPFHKTKKGEKGFIFLNLRKPLFIFGALVLMSWYFAFFMTSSYILESSFVTLFLIYLAYLKFAVLVALIWERSFNKPIIRL